MKSSQYNTISLTSKEITSILTDVPIFDKLTPYEIKIISRYFDTVKFDVGGVLFKEGEKGDFVCFVVEGTLEILKTSYNTDDIVIATIGKGRSIGEMAVIDDYTRSATVRAKTKTKLLLLNRKHFDHILEEHPLIGIKILKGITRLISLNLRKASSRLADYMMPVN